MVEPTIDVVEEIQWDMYDASSSGRVYVKLSSAFLAATGVANEKQGTWRIRVTASSAMGERSVQAPSTLKKRRLVVLLVRSEIAVYRFSNTSGETGLGFTELDV
jgi:hypothetical protein